VLVTVNAAFSGAAECNPISRLHVNVVTLKYGLRLLCVVNRGSMLK